MELKIGDDLVKIKKTSTEKRQADKSTRGKCEPSVVQALTYYTIAD